MPHVDHDLRCSPEDILVSLDRVEIEFVLTYRDSRAYVLKVPPSPSLSARKMISTYFTVTIMNNAHSISERAPMRSIWLGAEVKVDEYTYSGEVPISP